MSMDKLPDREGISTAPVPEVSMRGESDTPAGGEQTSQDTVAQARIDCRAAFDHGLAGTKLAEDAVTFPDDLFDRTVKYAIEWKGFPWKKDDRTNIALEGMEKIAARAAAQARARGIDVPQEFLGQYEIVVIQAGKTKCDAKSASKIDAIFCVLYATNGTYTGSETGAGGNGEGAPRNA